MKVFVLYGSHDLRSDERPAAVPGPDDVVIDIKRVGICGSDVHYFRNFRIGSFVPRAPLVLGHEFAGEVVETGSSVNDPCVGDRVTVEPSIECRDCMYCRTGRYNLCTNLKFVGTAATIPHIDGAFAEQIAVPARSCFRLPDNVGFAVGALAEPLAVGFHAVSRGGRVAGNRVLVCGGGTIGQMVIAAAQSLGADDITLVDPAEFPRILGRSRGVTDVYEPRSGDVQRAIATSAMTGGFDLLFEASGSAEGLRLCYEASARGARLVQIGTQPDSVELPANLVMAKELTILGSFRYAHVFPAVLRMIASGRVKVQEFVTATYPFADFPAAMARAAEGKEIVKVQVSRE